MKGNRRCTNIEKRWYKLAKTIRPEEWRNRVDTIKDITIRIQVACLVWWDYLAGRPYKSRWPQLDTYLNGYRPSVKADQKKTAKALQKIGYPIRLSKARVAAMITENT